MKVINLREYYPHYHTEFLLEVADEIAYCFQNFKRQEHAYQMRRKRYKAFYSLDKRDGVEEDIVFVSLSPHEIYERKLTCQKLHAAISSLPDKQAKRIYAHFFLDMSYCAISHAESISESAVRASIYRGLGSMGKFLKNYK